MTTAKLDTNVRNDRRTGYVYHSQNTEDTGWCRGLVELPGDNLNTILNIHGCDVKAEGIARKSSDVFESRASYKSAN